MSDFDENAAETDPFTPPSMPRPRGMPGKAGKKTVVTRQEFHPDEKSSEIPALTFASLFDDGEADMETPVRVRVTRKEPDEGMLGYIDDMDATEQAILDRWGGGSVFRLDGLNTKGKVCRSKTVRLAGEPIFMSDIAEITWRKSKGLPPKMQAYHQPPGQLSSQEVLKLLDEREEKRAAIEEKNKREERERGEERRREERDNDEKRRQVEREWKADQDRQQREWDERRRREDSEMIIRRRQEEQDNENKRMVLATSAQQQQQQFMQMMITMTQQQAAQSIAFVRETAGSGGKGGDSTDALMKGVQLVMSIKESMGGGDGGGVSDDLLTTVVKNLPGMLSGIGNAAGQVVREFKGNAPGATAGALTGPSMDANGSLSLPPGDVSAKFTEIINRIAKSGGDPEKALGLVADRLLANSAGTNTSPKAIATPSLPVVGGPGYKAPAVEASPAPVAPTTSRMSFKKSAPVVQSPA